MKLFYKYIIGVALLVVMTGSIAGCSSDDTIEATNVTPMMKWDGKSVELSDLSGWCITRYNNRIALSDYSHKQQYLLTWDGDSGNGGKSNAKLQIAEVGFALESYDLDTLTVRDIDGTYYDISFSSSDKSGEFLIEK